MVGGSMGFVGIGPSTAIAATVSVTVASASPAIDTMSPTCIAQANVTIGLNHRAIVTIRSNLETDLLRTMDWLRGQEVILPPVCIPPRRVHIVRSDPKVLRECVLKSVCKRM
eukprot:5333634-Pyramimonas_sp.AAC.1